MAELREQRTLTEKAEANYEDRVAAFKKKLQTVEESITDLLSPITTGQLDVATFEHLTRPHVVQYKELSTGLCDYLTKVKTVESQAELEQQLARESAVLGRVNVVKSEIGVESTVDKAEKVSRHSSCSNASSRIMEKLALSKAKLEGAVTKLKYVKQEVTLKQEDALLVEQEMVAAAQRERKRSEIANKLEILREEKEVETVKAETTALENSLSDIESVVSVPKDNVMIRTAQFITQTSMDNDPPPLLDQPEQPGPETYSRDFTRIDPGTTDWHVPLTNSRNVTETTPVVLDSRVPISHSRNGIQAAPDFDASVPIPHSRHVMDTTLNRVDSSAHTYHSRHVMDTVQNLASHPRRCADTQTNRLDPEAHVFRPSMQESTSQQSLANDLTRFLLKKDLLLSRLTNFNDKAENYRTWKTSFKAIMYELNVTAMEEIDLLQKWAGPESQRQVMNIKAANVSNPDLCVARIWQRLEERYGCAEMLESALKKRVENFPKLSSKDTKRLYDFSDLVSEIESVKADKELSALFGHYDSSTGVTPLVNKLPHFLQEKWTTIAAKYMSQHCIVFPPFSVFANFLREQSKIRNNPSFAYDSCAPQAKREQVYQRPKLSISAKKTETRETQRSSPSGTSRSEIGKCPLHQSNHSLNNCRAFRAKPLHERFKILRDKNICFGCCESTSHVKRDCTQRRKCSDCQSDQHSTALHLNSRSIRPPGHGGESAHTPQLAATEMSSACTQICGQRFPGKSCAKIVLCDVHLEDNPGNSIRLYAIIDDQSNASMASSTLFDRFGVEDVQTQYTLMSCSGRTSMSGRRIKGVVVHSHDKSTEIKLPVVTECSYIPNNREEIPTPEVAKHYPHLSDIATNIPPLDENAEILLLIGRDVANAHHVLEQKIGPGNRPFAQRMHLGWTIIGESCLGNAHPPEQINVKKTNVLANGRTSLFEPCGNAFHLKTSYGQDLFEKTEDDEKPGLSVDDRNFLELMNEGFQKDEDGRWTSPLPFREGNQKLKNNYHGVLKRAKNLDHNLRKNPSKRKQFIEFMGKLLEKGHAEKAPALDDHDDCWYLPIFPVYHPKKPDQIRVVFDSAAKYNNVSLNNVLLQGPDLTNSLLGVLLRFRREEVAIMADIEQMFYCFRVIKTHRKYIRFLWHEDNDFDKPLTHYQMCAHVFGNTASPAVATYGLRKTVNNGAVDPDVVEFVNKNFYVDDGLASVPTVEEAVSLVTRTQEVLKNEGKLRLHKIASNKEEVLTAFPSNDLARDVKDVDFGKEILPTQRSLGVAWDLETDSFLFHISEHLQPYTRRGLLSTVNSIFDPIGFLAPVVIEGKLLLRTLVQETTDWDAALPEEYQHQWNRWRSSLNELHDLRIPRVYVPASFRASGSKSVHVFSDASELAISAVAFLKVSDERSTELGFILGKAKVAPMSGHTIPRLELCAAVLAVEVAESIAQHLELPLRDFRFYTDSKVVLGYIHNQTRRFYTYVSNRVHRIRSTINPDQWSYVSTERNPADQATRPTPASELNGSMWLEGPAFLRKEVPHNEVIEMQNPDEDIEVRPQITNLKTTTTNVVMPVLGSHRFSRFSSWKKLTEAVALLKRFASTYSKNIGGKKDLSDQTTAEALKVAERYILGEIQKETYQEEIDLLKNGKSIPKSSSIAPLCPVLGADDLLRVGGRLKNSTMRSVEKNPVLVPRESHVALLLIRHYHEKVHHQGRHITAGAVRSAGYWITGSKRLVSSSLSKCVKCKVLRGKLGCQKMADLPSDRLDPGPPFTNVGVDCFGPWNVVSRRTRGGQANSKRWAALFTCLTSRAVHIEVLEELSTSSFINALKRFMAIRGPVKTFRSDRGTNFVGTMSECNVDTINVEEGPTKTFLVNNHCTWIFNPPHASHMGGVWERMIGVTRRILDSLLMDVPGRSLTHEVLVTFLAEASAIVNSRPLTPVSTDPEDPYPLSPSSLLTQKTCEVEPLEDFSTADMYGKQWKRVKMLADTFWSRWRSEYLHTLQCRRKWTKDQRNFRRGDVVLLRDKGVSRYEWPMGLITDVHTGNDGLVRSVVVRVIQDGSRVALFTRPVTELVLLVPENCA